MSAFVLDVIIPGNQKGISNGRDLIKSTWQPNEQKLCCWEMRMSRRKARKKKETS